VLPLKSLVTCRAALDSIEAIPRSEIAETAVQACDGRVTTTEIRKAVGMLIKAGLVCSLGSNEQGETLWEIARVPEDEMLWAIDRAMAARLLSGLGESGIEYDIEAVKPLLLSEKAKADTAGLIEEAEKMSRTPVDQD
jgi:hypothetical protein